MLPVSWLFLKDYQKERITDFRPSGKGSAGQGLSGHSVEDRDWFGRLLGKGIFNGTQNQLGFLPTRHTDFIFSVVGEELGFVGVIVTLGLLAFIIFRSIYNAQTARDNLGLFIVMGVVGIYFFHIDRERGNGYWVHADHRHSASVYELWRFVRLDRLHRPGIGHQCSPLPLRELTGAWLYCGPGAI